MTDSTTVARQIKVFTDVSLTGLEKSVNTFMLTARKRNPCVVALHKDMWNHWVSCVEYDAPSMSKAYEDMVAALQEHE